MSRRQQWRRPSRSPTTHRRHYCRRCRPLRLHCRRRRHPPRPRLPQRRQRYLRDPQQDPGQEPGAHREERGALVRACDGSRAGWSGRSFWGSGWLESKNLWSALLEMLSGRWPLNTIYRYLHYKMSGLLFHAQTHAESFFFHASGRVCMGFWIRASGRVSFSVFCGRSTLFKRMGGRHGNHSQLFFISWFV